MSGEDQPSAAAVARRAAASAANCPSFTGLQTRLRRRTLEKPRTPVSQLILRDPWRERVRDETELPDASRMRVRTLVEENPVDDELVAMATFVRSPDGRSLTTFNGGKAHVNGFMACPKSHRLLHYQGTGQESLVLREQTSWRTVAIATEAFIVRWNGGEHRPDVQLTLSDGSMRLIEVKRDERDLANPRLRRNIAMASEILRRSDIGYEVVFAGEIFANARHRRNVALFASRGFAHVSKRQSDRLSERAAGGGSAATYGELVELMSPRDALGGAAVVQSLVVRRRIEIDLAQRVTADTPVTIH